MQYPILGKKKKRKGKMYQKVVFQVSGLHARPSSIAFILQLQGVLD